MKRKENKENNMRKNNITVIIQAQNKTPKISNRNLKKL